jgi:CRP-like cAMP-binding protein
MPQSKELPPAKNRLLATLPDGDYQRLAHHLEAVRLPRNRILYEASDQIHHAYFLSGGMASLLAITEAGQTIDISMVGSEGFIGVPIILSTSVTPCRVVVQMPCEAHKLAAEPLLSEFKRGGALQQLLLRYTHLLQTQMVQSAVCHALHGVSQRICRYLMTMSDYVRADDFALTQEDFALMLGHERSRVSLRAGELQKRRLIKYGRGRVTILDRQGLEAAACECYRIIKQLN